MKVGIMQPYFFPYIGYFSLIHYVDKFIFFDTPQYISHGWVNRNRILRQNGTPGYITVPIQKASQKTAINEIVIANNIDWRNKIYGQLTVYRRKAPYYEEVMSFLHAVFDEEYNNLSDFNIKSIKSVCSYLGIKKDFDVFSQMKINVPCINEPDEWALYITKAVGGESYVNPPGGQTFFRRNKYKEQNINLEFLQSNCPVYIQRIGYFVPGLSIIDVMMFYEKKEIVNMLNDFKIF